MIKYDYRKLVGTVVEKYGSQLEFAKAMNLSERTMSLKLNSKIGFKQEEIIKASQLLEIKNEDIPRYFFNHEVQKG